MTLEGQELEKQIRIAALENAVKFNGGAKQGAVIGKLFSLDQTLKARMKDIAPLVGKTLNEVNALDVEEQKRQLLQLDPSFEKKEKTKKEQRKKEARELPPLKDAEEGKVITRMPPGPSKHPHAGHAVSFGINYLYAQSYDGQCILRFDDTNPEVEKQEFVDAIKEDIIDYLGMKPTKIVFASDHIGTMIEKVEELIKDHHIYACSCPSESISKDRKSMKECPHRSQTRNETKGIWDEMKEGRKKNYALRLRIDMAHKNAVMRDPVIFRVITTPHYRQKKKYTVWPMYDFESPFMDGYLGITHVMRSNEFDSRIELHHYIAELLGFPKIPYKHYGRISITGSLTKGREIREKIEKGNFIGWDDPRLVTLKALRRRGITKEALHNLAKTAGMSKQNTNIDFSVIASENRKILDESAHRFFFIKKPKKVTIEGAPSLDNELHLHPEHARGGRRMRSTDTFYIEEDDCKQIKEGEICRLMDCLNFTKKGNRFIYHSTPYEEYKGKGRTIIHWLPAGEKLLDVEVFMPDATTLKGLGEQTIRTLKTRAIIQFERFGFCRLDAIDKKEHVYRFWYTHD